MGNDSSSKGHQSVLVCRTERPWVCVCCWQCHLQNPPGLSRSACEHPVSSPRKMSGHHPHSVRVFLYGNSAFCSVPFSRLKGNPSWGGNLCIFPAFLDTFPSWAVLLVRMTQELPVCESNVLFFFLAVSCSCRCSSVNTRAYISHYCLVHPEAEGRWATKLLENSGSEDDIEGREQQGDVSEFVNVFPA